MTPQFLHASFCPRNDRCRSRVVMMHRITLFTLSVSLLLSSGCAAKNRWFSRRDYSEMQDPFMESDALADSTGATGTRGGDRTGRARLGGQTADADSLTDSAPQGAPRTATSAASYSDSDSSSPADGRRSYVGSQLSQLLNRRPATTTSEPAPGSPSAAGTAADPLAASALNPLRSKMAAADSSAQALTQDAEQFGSFLQDKKSAALESKRQATQAVESGEESLEDFAAWAAEQQESWKTSAEQTASAIPAAAKGRVKAVSHEARETAEEAFNDFAAPDAAEDQATPLVPKPARRGAKPAVHTQEPEFDVSPSGVNEDVEENPFENPFDSADFSDTPPRGSGTSRSSGTRSSEKQTSSRSSKSRSTVDDSFQMSSGWKPSDLSNP